MRAQKQLSGYPVWHVIRKKQGIELMLVGGLCCLSFGWHVTEHGAAYACNKEEIISCNMQYASRAAARGCKPPR